MGNSIGKEVQLYPPIKKIHIELHWTDLGDSIKAFGTGHEFVAFLAQNPILNAALFPGERTIAPGTVEVATKVLFPPLQSVDISLYWHDRKLRGNVHFKTVHQFAAFLKENPELARAVGYVARDQSPR